MHVIDISIEEGNLLGYVCDSTEPNIVNYFTEHIEGFERLHEALEHYDRPVALLRNLYVEEEARGQGLGRQLLEEFLADHYVQTSGGVLLVADLGESQNEGFDLIGWYESLGFAVVGHTDSGYPVMVNNEQLARELQRFAVGSEPSGRHGKPYPEPTPK